MGIGRRGSARLPLLIVNLLHFATAASDGLHTRVLGESCTASVKGFLSCLHESGLPAARLLLGSKEDGVQRSQLRSLRGAGIVYRQHIDASRMAANESLYSCASCGTHVASSRDIISRSFQGRTGRAYLLSNLVNFFLGPREDRVLLSGLHMVADIHCRSCQGLLGWKYLEASDPAQKYKTGKFILEKAKLVRFSRDEALAEEDELRAEGASEGIVAREASEAETQPDMLRSTPQSAETREDGHGREGLQGADEEMHALS